MVSQAQVILDRHDRVEFNVQPDSVGSWKDPRLAQVCDIRGMAMDELRQRVALAAAVTSCRNALQQRNHGSSPRMWLGQWKTGHQGPTDEQVYHRPPPMTRLGVRVSWALWGASRRHSHPAGGLASIILTCLQMEAPHSGCEEGEASAPPNNSVASCVLRLRPDFEAVCHYTARGVSTIEHSHPLQVFTRDPSIQMTSFFTGPYA